MWEKLKIFVWVWCVLCGSGFGRFIVTKNSLEVTSPESMNGFYDSLVGIFGGSNLGGTMAGTVIYPKSNRKACRSFEDFGFSFNSYSGGLPTFLLADRGDCFFSLKAWRAQNAGVAAILIADDRREPLFNMESPEEYYPGSEYVQEIFIPSAFIMKALGDDMKRELSDGQMVNVTLDWTGALPRIDLVQNLGEAMTVIDGGV
ncbi:vacuolar-sorting receptor 1-like [Rhodamnia argentea]|uniref:Vacuolar-sorting receptor 1-like n=1 Tax=Rhodamnia argentea TaxID=178133 RepID=A0A8B8QX18_9MYRT|nr:vacuolar-sorting receptor 1-like [Rhodamnia argentea]